MDFNKLSVMDGIDEIMAQIIQIEQMVSYQQDNSDNQYMTQMIRHLSIVQCKLENTKIKCATTDQATTLDKSVQVDFHNSASNETYKKDHNNLQSQLVKLNKKMLNSTEKRLLSMLVELKRLEQEAKIQQVNYFLYTNKI